MMPRLREANQRLQALERRMWCPQLVPAAQQLYVGVDLGTAYIVLTVVDAQKEPVAGALAYAEVVRDGLVVDYLGAVSVVKKLRQKIEDQLGLPLTVAATSYPPGTGGAAMNTHRNVVEAAGLEVTGLVDEPTAANVVLGVENGAIVDVGGGTTGIAVIRDGQVVYVADEPTGGIHFTLVLAGAYRIPFREAEELKTRVEGQEELLPLLKPVMQKVATIVKNHIKGYGVNSVYLVGGTSCLKGLDRVVEEEIGVKTFKPDKPLLVTPLGIAMYCG